MLKIQITLIVTLIVCVAFVSCDRAQDMLAPVTDDMTATGDTAATDGMMMVMKTIDPSVYMSWAHVALDAPTMSVAEAKEAMNPAATGAAHNPGSDVFTSRTVYFNETGAMANKAGTTPYPAGTMIIKAIMDETETAVDKVAVMMKSDDPMYAGHNGWMYAKYFLSEDGTPELKAGSHVPGHEGNGCHACHTEAMNDSVFVSLSMDDTKTDNGSESQMFEITLTNLTTGEHGKSGQTLSPALFVTHAAGFKFAEEGKPASEALVAQAEGGKIDGLVALAEVAGANYKIAMNMDMTRRYTMPGQTTTVTIAADMMNSSLSVSSMLVSTNDAFIAAIDVMLFDADGMPVSTTIDLMAYDAGSEDNTEMASDIPGPLGLDADMDPAGSNDRAPTEDGVIMMHPGIQGGGDVTDAFAWEGPVATLKIMPVTNMNNGAHTDAGNGNGGAAQ